MHIIFYIYRQTTVLMLTRVYANIPVVFSMHNSDCRPETKLHLQYCYMLQVVTMYTHFIMSAIIILTPR